MGHWVGAAQGLTQIYLLALVDGCGMLSVGTAKPQRLEALLSTVSDHSSGWSLTLWYAVITGRRRVAMPAQHGPRSSDDSSQPWCECLLSPSNGSAAGYGSPLLRAVVGVALVYYVSPMVD